MRIDTDYEMDDKWSKFGSDPVPKSTSLHEAIFSNIDSHTSFGLSGRDVTHLTELSSLDSRVETVFLGRTGYEEPIISKNNVDASASGSVECRWGGAEPAQVTVSVKASVQDKGGSSATIEASRNNSGEKTVKATVETGTKQQNTPPQKSKQ
jgi:hypothetical protein